MQEQLSEETLRRFFGISEKNRLRERLWRLQKELEHLKEKSTQERHALKWEAEFFKRLWHRQRELTVKAIGNENPVFLAQAEEFINLTWRDYTPVKDCVITKGEKNFLTS